ncbi:hypothetical protein NBRC13296_27480 [Paenibacillus chitinolyticus]|uniref:hypothetical protein n=1 Tax=Paenibacillus chitinolyticus TaxID=79263 RepID=UPI0035590F35
MSFFLPIGERMIQLFQCFFQPGKLRFGPAPQNFRIRPDARFADTAMAGNLHHAALRSVSLHFMRNLAGAAAAPFVGWFLYRHSAIHYETFRSQMSVTNPARNSKMSELAGHLMAGGLTASEAKKSALIKICSQFYSCSASSCRWPPSVRP